MIVGDIHGNAEVLIRIFERTGHRPDANSLFHGDMKGCGPASVEVCLARVTTLQHGQQSSGEPPLNCRSGSSAHGIAVSCALERSCDSAGRRVGSHSSTSDDAFRTVDKAWQCSREPSIPIEIQWRNTSRCGCEPERLKQPSNIRLGRETQPLSPSSRLFWLGWQNRTVPSLR
jgi:hypothetical protein